MPKKQLIELPKDWTNNCESDSDDDCDWTPPCDHCMEMEQIEDVVDEVLITQDIHCQEMTVMKKDILKLKQRLEMLVKALAEHGS